MCMGIGTTYRSDTCEICNPTKGIVLIILRSIKEVLSFISCLNLEFFILFFVDAWLYMMHFNWRVSVGRGLFLVVDHEALVRRHV